MGVARPGDQAGVLWGGPQLGGGVRVLTRAKRAPGMRDPRRGRGMSGEAAARSVTGPATRGGTAGRRGHTRRTQRPPLRNRPHRLAATASPWLQPLATSSTASRSPTSTGRRSRPEVAQRETFTTASRDASRAIYGCRWETPEVRTRGGREETA